MSVYKLTYQKADGAIIDLPPIINKHADIKTLREFAAKAGYSHEEWGATHEASLMKFFENVSIRPLDTPPEAIEWKPFRKALRQEDGLFSHDWEVFEERIKNGVLNGIVDGNGKLIATINVMPKITERLREKLGITEQRVQVYETGAGWVNESHRGLGLYTTFRRKVLEEGDMSNRLLFSQSNGKGASLVNIREEWTLIPWREIPFASALMGWRTGDGLLGNQFMLSSGLRVPLVKGGLYQDSPIDFKIDPQTGKMSDDAKAALEDKFLIDDKMKLWTNDRDKAIKFESNIRAGLNIPNGTEQNVIDHIYSKEWLIAIGKDAVYTANGNGGQLDEDARGWAEFTGAYAPEAA